MITLYKNFNFFQRMDIFQKLFYGSIVLFLFALPLSESLKEIAMYMMFVIFIYFIIKKKISIEFDFINTILLLHVFVVLCGIFFGVNAKESLKQCSDIINITAVFIIFRNVNLKMINVDLICRILLASFIVTITWGITNFFLGKQFIELNSVGSPNRSAVYISLIFIMSTTFLLLKNKNLKYITYASLILSIFSIIFGGSRMAIYTLPLLIMAFMYLNNKLTLKNILLLIIGLGITFTVIILFFENSYFAQKILKGLSDTPRIELWISSLHIWSKHNLLFGIGVGNSIFFDPRVYFPSSPMTYINNAHNTFLDMLLERGLLGLLTYLLFIFSVLIKLIKLRKTNMDLKLYYDMGIIAFLAIFIMSFANITFRYEFAILAVIIWGFLLNKTFYKHEKIILN